MFISLLSDSATSGFSWQESFIGAMAEGGRYLGEYLTWQRILMLVIAFLLSGAISSLMNQQFVLKYFGPKSRKWLAFLMASISGAILSVCSCSVLPMFASIRKKGAGLGPATTFLFSGPAINILAITMTLDMNIPIGVARIICAIVLSLVIGIAMDLIFGKFEKESSKKGINVFEMESDHKRKWFIDPLFFITIIAAMFIGFGTVYKSIITSCIMLVVIIEALIFYSKDEIKDWLKASWDLFKKIAPLFIFGVYLAGFIQYLIPEEFVINLVGSNNIWANLFASISATLMYFATLTEIPIIQSFMALGMASGPALAMLLAGPSLSLPNMIVINRVLGVKRTAVYVGLVIVFSTILGLICGFIFIAMGV